MWQLRERWTAHAIFEQRAPQRVQLGPFRLRRLMAGILIALMALGAAYAGYHFYRPLNLTVIITSFLGGAALGVLAVVIPGQAARVFMRAWLGLGAVRKRRRMRALALREMGRLQRLAVEATTPAVRRDLAVAHYLRDNPEQAEGQLAAALVADPEDGSVLNNLGVVLAAMDQWDRAAQFFVRALGTAAVTEAQVNCALVAPLLSSPATLEAMLEATHLPPGGVALNNLGVCQAHLGVWERAELHFQAALREMPDLPAAQANVGLIAYRRGHLQEAADRVMEADRLAPAEPAFANCLGVILAAAGQLDQARYYLRRAQKVDPASGGIRLNALVVEALAGNWSGAAQGLTRFGMQRPNEATAHYNLALVHLALGEPYAAVDNASAAIAAGDTTCAAYTALAVGLWETGRRAEALSHFHTAVGTPTATPLAASNLGRALLLEGQIERAMAVLEPAFQKWPTDVYLAFDLATAVLAKAAQGFREDMNDDDRVKLALTLQRSLGGLEAAHKRGNGQLAEAHVNLGLYHYMQEQYERAADHFEAALRLSDKTRELQYLVGTSLARAGEQHALRTANGAVAPIAVGRQLLRRAVPYLEAAAESRETLADASYNLGRCLYVLEDFDRALEAFRRALAVERSEEMYMLAALAAARQGQELQLMARGHLLMPDVRRDQLRERSMELLNTAVHYFSQALLRNEINPMLHGNLGVAYMLRNREHDIESALRHWERMRAIGGGAVERRYAELSQIGAMADAARIAFDDQDITVRGIEVRRWLSIAPPRPDELRFLLEAVAVQEPWRVVVDSPLLAEALELRARIAHDRLRAARLRV